jgi:hypothetical protein
MAYVKVAQKDQGVGLKLTEEASEYGAAFFAGIEKGARRSADDVVALLLEIFSPTSIVDIGGGAGHWAAACLAQGVSDVLTIDGPWVPHAARAVPANCFLEHDLSLPLALERTFDLALCLEAAEHLPALAAPNLVRILANAAPVVVFSAALPGQGGNGHINEQLPSYWAHIFASQGYACFSDLRQRIWNNDAVEVWYRQNLLCFVRQSELHRWCDLLAEPIQAGDPLLDIAHPELVVRHHLRAERLEAYAHRLRFELDSVKLELDRMKRELNIITSSRVWRAWQMVSGPMRRLRGR